MVYRFVEYYISLKTKYIYIYLIIPCRLMVISYYCRANNLIHLYIFRRTLTCSSNIYHIVRSDIRIGVAPFVSLLLQ